ncbi:uncharacterized protein LOC115626598 [Scaptodrosophila lebanonensis]|uniref:Uncharacterized protein LOC115626598 n=1 Tax=Drosophila lebanonensis TaxID=7225 RepID=A0A6J2TSF2_DROLE|nr:uncharacterized protein LOC115626598 [Scaptodrosophila lebanonensis]
MQHRLIFICLFTIIASSDDDNSAVKYPLKGLCPIITSTVPKTTLRGKHWVTLTWAGSKKNQACSKKLIANHLKNYEKVHILATDNKKYALISGCNETITTNTYLNNVFGYTTQKKPTTAALKAMVAAMDKNRFDRKYLATPCDPNAL